MDSRNANEKRRRPYRSHKFPACDRCRKRKLRCTRDSEDQACLMCQIHEAPCLRPGMRQYASEPLEQPGRASSESLAQKQPQQQPQPRPTGSNNELSSRRKRAETEFISSPGSSTIIARPLSSVVETTESSVIVGPATATDVRMMENYVSRAAHGQNVRNSQLYQTVSDNPQDPVIYLTVPRRRPGMPHRGSPGDKQKEIFEQILGPHIEEVVKLYFTYIQPCFPILDEQEFLQLHATGDSELSSALLIELYASSLIYWNRSEVLSKIPRPDLSYAWNLAVTALQEEFLAPRMSTVSAALLDLTGRPVSSPLGNIINSGRTVALAHSLGLNRDPETWRLSQVEKSRRVRLWWGLLIHDRWSSFAHGVPAHINKNDYDVPVPSMDLFQMDTQDNSLQRTAAQSFIDLCLLTEILGDILLLVYDRRPKQWNDTSKLIRRLEVSLDTWEEKTLSEPNTGVGEPGYNSLKLEYLSVKMLLCKVSFQAASQSINPCSREVIFYNQALLRSSAIEILSFLSSMDASQGDQFWMPYSAYHMAYATMVLIRCILETSEEVIAQACRLKLITFMSWLRQAKDVYDWDLADICLRQCEQATTIMKGDQSQIHRPRDEVYGSQLDDGDDTAISGPSVPNGDVSKPPSQPIYADLETIAENFEYPFGDLWDMFEPENEQPSKVAHFYDHSSL